MFSKRALLSLFCLAVGISTSYAALGGGSCTIAAPGSPGATTVCTGPNNGFCLIDTLSVTGSNPVTSVTFTGICVCYYGYSGSSCGTFTSTTTTNNNNALTALVLGGLAAYALTNSGASTGLSTGSGLGSLNAQDILYLQQSGLAK